MSTTHDADLEPQAIGQGRASVVRYRPLSASRLPDREHALAWDDLLDAIGKSDAKKFQAAGLLVRRSPTESEPDVPSLWYAPADVVAWIDRYIDPNTTPCGCSTGIRTLEAGETYTCQNDECAETFDRATALEVVE